jgi:hypothetical protein
VRRKIGAHYRLSQKGVSIEAFNDLVVDFLGSRCRFTSGQFVLRGKARRAKRTAASPSPT